ncbi:AraC family transcriptional regulator [Dysgonomonas sp. 216]|uniref:helix-turn-helix transcriptional regulator n=1 Tax=Dysgonomonas sp. 216 TaxID=2302934 RepID=UPI0013D24DCA|nr:AraC family transcriptional regulator [Dysgonomonas sp. 216]NDW19467.1 AraC family transcriptional regulator [Dysgonomonas sp. 216]
MNTEYLNNLITIDLMHAGHGRFDENIQYSNIVSTFSRLYYIEKGKGEIILGNKEIALEEEYIYLIPGFEPCSYNFQEGISHYFIHCALTLENDISPFNLFSIINKKPSTDIDHILFKRIIELNPNINIPHHDPHIYEKKVWMNKELNYTGFAHYLETSGIMKLLLSRFIAEPESKPSNKQIRFNIQQIFSYIKNNINEDISVGSLAEMSHLSTDHFSRTFKSVIGIGPCEFILRQRLQTSQLLLLTTNMNLQEIVEAVNFKSLSYFSYVFKRYNGISPSSYRKNKMEHL